MAICNACIGRVVQSCTNSATRRQYTLRTPTFVLCFEYEGVFAANIAEIRAREIIGWRGNPTIEVDVKLQGGANLNRRMEEELAVYGSGPAASAFQRDRSVR